MLTADIRTDALLDLDLQYEWYADVADEELAERYLAAFHETKEQLCLVCLTLAAPVSFEIDVLRGCGPSRFKARFTSTSFFTA
jgi:hypothetical protein